MFLTTNVLRFGFLSVVLMKHLSSFASFNKSDSTNDLKNIILFSPLPDTYQTNKMICQGKLVSETYPSCTVFPHSQK